MKNILISLFIMTACLSCDTSRTRKALLKEAESCMKGAMDEAYDWLSVFNKNGYATLLNQEYPPPFDTPGYDTMMTDSTQSRINRMEQEFGKVLEREFFGAHVVIHGKLLSYVPAKMKRFRQISPKRLGLNNIADLYKDQVEGSYVLLMYNAKPAKKEHAEELIVMWLANNSKWRFVDYYIDNEI